MNKRKMALTISVATILLLLTVGFFMSLPKHYSLRIWGTIYWFTGKFVYTRGDQWSNEYYNGYVATVKINIENLGKNDIHKVCFGYIIFPTLKSVEYFGEDVPIGTTRIFTLTDFLLDPSWTEYTVCAQIFFQCTELHKNSLIELYWEFGERASQEIKVNW